MAKVIEALMARHGDGPLAAEAAAMRSAGERGRLAARRALPRLLRELALAKGEALTFSPERLAAGAPCDGPGHWNGLARRVLANQAAVDLANLGFEVAAVESEGQWHLRLRNASPLLVAVALLVEREPVPPALLDQLPPSLRSFFVPGSY